MSNPAASAPAKYLFMRSLPSRPAFLSHGSAWVSCTMIGQARSIRRRPAPVCYSSDCRISVQNLAQEQFCALMLGMRKEFVRPVHFYDLPGIHEDDAVGDLAR